MRPFTRLALSIVPLMSPPNWQAICKLHVFPDGSCAEKDGVVKSGWGAAVIGQLTDSSFVYLGSMGGAGHSGSAVAAFPRSSSRY